jgi:hypothetical protein
VLPVRVSDICLTHTILGSADTISELFAAQSTASRLAATIPKPPLVMALLQAPQEDGVRHLRMRNAREMISVALLERHATVTLMEGVCARYPLLSRRWIRLLGQGRLLFLGVT